MAKGVLTREMPGAPEVFADGVTNVAVRRNVVRLTLLSERFEPEKADITERVIVGHIAMSMAGFLDLYARMGSLVDQMKDRGALVDRETSAKKIASKKSVKRVRSKGG